MRGILLFFVFSLCLYAEVRDINIAPALKNQRFMQIKILDQKELSLSSIDGIAFYGLSDLVYESSTQSLYMVGDRGMLYRFHALFSDKIESLVPEHAWMIKNKKSKIFKPWRRDTEGLVMDKKGRLLISFEGKAKIGWFHKNGSKIGTMIKEYRLPKCLKNGQNYRSSNKSLEALAYHPKFGILTATEWPLKRDDIKRQTIYALSGKKWHFKAEPETNSAVVAIEMMDDGNLLVMERSFSGLLSPFVITLKKVMLKSCTKGFCPHKVLAKMNSHKGWDVDNFEGLARIPTNRYVMVSDDNGNFFQKTLLLYFEVKEDG